MCPYRAAIIGTGRIASILEKDPLRSKPHSHAGWYRHHPNIELVGGADLDRARLEAFGQDWGIPGSHLFVDYHEMLDCLRPDLVSICAYAPQRLEMIQASVEAGARGLWIEKAIACSLEQAHTIQQLLFNSKVKAIVDHPRRADGAFRAVKRIIEQHSLGTLTGITCMMNGSLMHTGTHAYDILQFWCGEMEAAIGWLERPLPPEGPMEDGGGSGHMIFDSGVHAYIAGSTRDYYIFQFDLAFTNGRIQIGNDIRKVMRPEPSKLYSGFEELFEDPGFQLNDPYPYPMVYDLIHALDTDVEPLMSVNNAVSAFKMGLALFQSHHEGHRLIRPAELNPSLRIDSI